MTSGIAHMTTGSNKVSVYCASTMDLAHKRRANKGVSGGKNRSS